MHKRLNQVLVALLMGTLFFGFASLNAKPAYAETGTIFLPLMATQNNDNQISGSCFGDCPDDDTPVKVYKFKDVNGDGDKDGSGEPYLEDWSFTATFINDPGCSGSCPTYATQTGTTNSSGYVWWSLHRGNWEICETVQSGWYPTGDADAQGCKTVHVDWPLPQGQLYQKVEFGNINLGNPSCANLNALDAFFPTITSDFGFKIEDWNDSIPDSMFIFKTGTQYGYDTEMTGGAADDLGNSVTLDNADNNDFDWLATLGIDAVIVKGGTQSAANVYGYDPESFGDNDLHTLTLQGISHVEFCFDYEPQVSKTATATYKTTHTWEITKTVTPPSQSGFVGENLPWTWTVDVSESAVKGDYSVTGQIIVANPNPGQAVSGTLADVLNDGANTPATINGCSGDGVSYVAGTLTVNGGKTATCTYSASPPDKTATKNYVTFTSGGVDYTAEAPLDWALDQVINGTATLSDVEIGLNEVLTAGQGPWTRPGDDSHTCSTNPDKYAGDGEYSETVDNTATVTGSEGQSDSDDASTTYTCYGPVVTKTADGLYDVRHTWEITKTVDPPSQSGFVGENLPWTWTVKVSETSDEENFRVGGTISVYNPADESMTVDVADVLDDATAATVDCNAGQVGNQTSLTIAAGATESCTYSAAPTDKTATLNTATATFRTVDFTGTADVGWALDQVINGTATLSDVEIGLNEVLTAGQGPWTRPGDDSHTCSTNPDDYAGDGEYSETVDNTATVTGSEGQSASDDASTTYTCYGPVVEKDAAGTYDERYDWDVLKTVDPPSQSAFAGDPVNWDWTILVTETTTDENFSVTGVISITNPAGSPGDMEVSLVDVLSDLTGATVECGAGSSVTVASGATETCTYSAAPNGALATSNTVTATFKTIDFTDTAGVAFVKNVVNDEATLSDTEIGLDGEGVTGGDVFTDTAGTVCSDKPADYRDGGKYTAEVSNTAILVDEEESEYKSTAKTTYTCYGPVVEKDATTLWEQGVDWTLEKSVTPASAKKFAGESASFDYTVMVTKTLIDKFTVSGLISVTNPAGSPGAMEVSLVDLLDGEAAASVDCGDGATVSVATGETVTCSYTGELPEPVVEGSNTVTATFNGIGFTATAGYGFNEVPDSDGEPGEITVQDVYNGGSAEVLGVTEVNATYTYTRAETCSSEPSDYTDGFYSTTYPNTASIVETDDSDSEQVTLDCYAPVVSKDADTEWLRTYTWTIDKSVAPASHAGFPGDTFESTYTVVVNQTVNDTFAAFGTISVFNRADAPGSITVDMADEVGASTATVNCGGGSTSLTVAPGDTETCSYSMDLPDATDLTNTATVSFHEIDFTAGADVIFGEPTIVGFPTINVNDFFDGGAAELIGSAIEDDTFTYDRPFACPINADAYEGGVYSDSFPNIAEIDETGQQDNANVDVDCELLAGLGDLVWLDLDLDGQQDANEPGIPGVTVELLQDDIVIDTTITDANGNYAFTGLEAGTYSVRFPTIGLTDDNVDPDDTDSDADPVLGMTTTTLEAGEFDPTLDAGYIPAALGDFVWEDDGDGVQEGEPGVPGVTVNLLKGGSVISTTTTDVNGNYLFEGLMAGEYEVCFILPEGYDEFTAANQGGNDGVDSDAAESGVSKGCTGPIITLEFGETDLTWDAGLVKTEIVAEPASLGDFVWEDKNTNGEQDETDTGVQGVVVNLKQGGTIILTATTDVDGKYLFENLTPGAYEVCFVKPQNFNFTKQGPNTDKDETDSDATESGDATGCTGSITLGSGEEDLSWDAGLVSTIPTNEEEGPQPSGPRTLFLPTLQTSASGTAAQAVTSGVAAPSDGEALYLPSVQGD